jgi:predicted aspartyl protease
VPRAVLEALGCEPHCLQPVRFADGRVEEWPVAEVEVECEGRRATTTVFARAAP